ncbi:radical S-adenosyl methionine and flavodoxin domains 1 (predicted), isoform CRA_a [Rattus norvegicus]|nr:tRNA wybutosine-synthesizing protein 1 homolog [Rattus norvegicus]AAI68924.1 TRNA-yW synthesizing protein 1 homolog (S. cerevisiae) [Rattus norvegicus]EDM13460.1 radical S-adenosyl methionine and flavodoxin domains 1 (predicted), isoform CRA_a [Rattus norvegicus]|eukprot:NP_001100607.1 tRNA wybutosine-synthesizing protein 1 homolog [Rattus norvegicus]
MGPPLDVWDFSSPLLSLWMNRFYIYMGCALGVTLWFCVQIIIKKQVTRSQEKSVPGAPDSSLSPQEKHTHVSGVKIFYGSQTGTAKGFAVVLAKAVTSLDLPVAIINLKEYDPDDNLIGEITSKNVCAFLVATYTDGRPTESAEWFCKWLEEAANDFRFGKTYLKGLRYAVFGLGDSAYRSHFNKVSTNVDKWLWMLGAQRVLTRGEGDCNAVQSKHGSIEADFTAWKTKFISRLQALQRGEKKGCGGDCKRGKCESAQHGPGEVRSHPHGELHPGDAEEEEPCESSSEDEHGTKGYQSLNSVVDVEDLGNIMNPVKREKREKAQPEEKVVVHRNSEKNEDSEARAMITPALREALTKQGYQLIGSHSGVKLCRWTKSMLRGRGGCYKHTFYGIESHRCMEATPSLACANKCVFCWRHHTNPVGTEWRWKMDQPELILKEAIENHRNMIKQFKGVPGLKAERFEEGMEVKHCALSLVGEPIMYPEINRLLKLLHQHGISTFLVTNAQFPEEIRNLTPVTQLYVSVDASTKDSLKKIDRPLFKDFWQRFLDSLQALSAKQQRTVYRLTLVKCWNVDELQAYAELVSLGSPDFIEVKGVTYCGESAASSLTMANVPWHEEVVRFVRELVDLLPDYEIACEHEHSNCLLIGHKKFKIGGEWWTWIDYSRFQELVLQYEESGGSKTFSSKDYMARTPQWALFGARERGFDPKDTRYQRKNKTKDISGC